MNISRTLDGSRGLTGKLGAISTRMRPTSFVIRCRWSSRLVLDGVGGRAVVLGGQAVFLTTNGHVSVSCLENASQHLVGLVRNYERARQESPQIRYPEGVVP